MDEVASSESFHDSRCNVGDLADDLYDVGDRLFILVEPIYDALHKALRFRSKVQISSIVPVKRISD
jgi:hypothetical protein